ncbi:MAG: nitroreductase [Pseudomonadota bacterium]
MQVREAVTKRSSTRAFLNEPVPAHTVEDLIEAAVRAPSGGNVQPWQIIAVAGREKDAVSAAALKSLLENPDGEEGDYPIYPPKLHEPYRSRRFDIGERLYETVGIARDDKAARQQQMLQNFAFFGAPVGLFIVIDRRMGHGQWAHVGMLMQTIALLAVDAGLATCMQEAWARVRESVRQVLGVPESHVVYCAIALGYADPAAPVNQLVSPRAPLHEILTLKGFSEAVV